MIHKPAVIRELVGANVAPIEPYVNPRAKKLTYTDHEPIGRFEGAAEEKGSHDPETPKSKRVSVRATKRYRKAFKAYEQHRMHGVTPEQLLLLETNKFKHPLITWNSKTPAGRKHI
jgi:hypothetical protein